MADEGQGDLLQQQQLRSDQVSTTTRDEMPTTGAKNGLKLADMRGMDYDDAEWDKLLRPAHLR